MSTTSASNKTQEPTAGKQKQQQKQDQVQPAGFLRCLLFAIGCFAEFVPTMVIGAFTQFVFSDIIGMRTSHVSVVWAIFNISKGAMLLFFGQLFDNTTMSRRSVCFLASIPLLSGFYITWVVPAALEADADEKLAVYLAVSLLVFGCGHCATLLIRAALFSEVFADSERGTVTGLKQLVIIIGIMAGMIAPPIISDGFTDRERMARILTIACAVSCVATLLSAWAHDDSKRISKLATKKPHKTGLISRLIAPVLELPAYRAFIIAWFFAHIAFSCLMATGQQYVKYLMPLIANDVVVWGTTLDSKAQVGVAQGIAQFASLFSTPFWLKFKSSSSTATTWMVSCFLFGFVTLLKELVSTRTFYAMLFFECLSNVMIAPLLFLPPMALTEISERDTAQRGESRQGLLHSLGMILLLVSAVFQGAISGYVLSAGGYVGGQSDQTSSALHAITTVHVYIPCVCLMVSVLCMFAYRLDPVVTPQKKDK